MRRLSSHILKSAFEGYIGCNAMFMGVISEVRSFAACSVEVDC